MPRLRTRVNKAWLKPGGTIRHSGTAEQDPESRSATRARNGTVDGPGLPAAGVPLRVRARLRRPGRTAWLLWGNCHTEAWQLVNPRSRPWHRSPPLADDRVSLYLKSRHIETGSTQMHPSFLAWFRADPFDAYRVRAHRGPMGADPRGRHGLHGPHGRGPGDRRMFGRGGRGDLARFFAHGDLRLVILHLIAEKPRHGYEIIKAIEERVGGAYSPSPGTVYPTLTLLEELGHVTVTPGEGTKRLHTITPEGQSFLDGNRSIPA